uniref:Uncharacterized protein n=1 Tax=Cucumis sativus TaxID=3659 RepID=A0A0A0LJN2_CUCSA
MLIGSIVGAISGLKHGGKKINGTVVLVRDNVLDFNDFGSTVLDNLHELLGGGVSLQLVSAQHGDPCEFFFCLNHRSLMFLCFDFSPTFKQNRI